MNIRRHLPGQLHLLRLLTAIFILIVPSLNAKTVLVLGDSLSAGLGINIEDGWVQLLSHHLNGKGAQTQNSTAGKKIELDRTEEKKAAPKAYRVVNASISGETSAGGLARLPSLLREHKPDVVIVELGGNDGLRGYPVPLIRRNLTGIVEMSRDANADVLLLGMQIPPNYGQRYTRLFADVYTELAKDSQIPLVPFFLDKVALKPELMQADGIHPKTEAQSQMLKNVLPYLQPLL